MFLYFNQKLLYLIVDTVVNSQVDAVVNSPRGAARKNTSPLDKPLRAE